MARPTKWTKELEEQAYDYIRDYGNHGHMILYTIGQSKMTKSFPTY